MKKFLFTLLISLISLGFTSCSKDDEQKHNSEYYVKYKFNCGNNVHYTKFDIEYTNKIDGKCRIDRKEYGANTTNFHGSKHYEDEITCGPFNYNDVVSLTVTNEHEVTFRNLEIHISKDSSPFSLKKYGNSHSISYTINY